MSNIRDPYIVEIQQKIFYRRLYRYNLLYMAIALFVYGVFLLLSHRILGMHIEYLWILCSISVPFAYRSTRQNPVPYETILQWAEMQTGAQGYILLHHSPIANTAMWDERYVAQKIDIPPFKFSHSAFVKEYGYIISAIGFMVAMNLIPIPISSTVVNSQLVQREIQEIQENIEILEQAQIQEDLELQEMKETLHELDTSQNINASLETLDSMFQRVENKQQHLEQALQQMQDMLAQSPPADQEMTESASQSMQQKMEQSMQEALEQLYQEKGLSKEQFEQYAQQEFSLDPSTQQQLSEQIAKQQQALKQSSNSSQSQQKNSLSNSELQELAKNGQPGNNNQSGNKQPGNHGQSGNGEESGNNGDNAQESGHSEGGDTAPLRFGEKKVLSSPDDPNQLPTMGNVDWEHAVMIGTGPGTYSGSASKDTRIGGTLTTQQEHTNASQSNIPANQRKTVQQFFQESNK